jgi:cysteine desulfurase
MEIYLDNAATARPWPEVIEAVAQTMGGALGNPSSSHRPGLAAARAFDDSRAAVAQAVGSGPWKVVFTSGGSESITTAVLGSAPRGKRRRVVTTSLDHPATLGACALLAEQGCEIVQVPAERGGVVDVQTLVDQVNEQTCLVSFTALANEVGTVQETARIAEQVKARAPRCRIHVDAVQAFAQLATLDLPPAVDMVSVSAHKVHGPQGVGALLLRPEVKPRALICGGGQQEGVRPGTPNVAGVVGFARAARIMSDRQRAGAAQMSALSEKMIARLTGELSGVRLLGDPGHRAPGMVVLAVSGVKGEVLLHALEMRGVIASSSSACHSGSGAPSASLAQAGLEDDEGPIRLSLSIDTSPDEIETAGDRFSEALAAVRTGRTGELG